MFFCGTLKQHAGLTEACVGCVKPECSLKAKEEKQNFNGLKVAARSWKRQEMV